MSGQYFDWWKDGGYERMVGDFAGGCPPAECILFATYGDPDEHGYSGFAHIIGKNEDGRLFYVQGSHCSCMGLEGQWEPEPTTMAALKMHRWSLASEPFVAAVTAWLNKEVDG